MLLDEPLIWTVLPRRWENFARNLEPQGQPWLSQGYSVIFNSLLYFCLWRWVGVTVVTSLIPVSCHNVSI